MQLRDGSESVSATDADLVQRGAVASPSTTRPPDQDTGLRPTTRLAVKALLASAVGLPLGLLLSPTHPYFVLVAASAVIALSFGSFLEAALQQTVTTVVGSLLGLGCAASLSETPERSAIIVVLIAACFFLGVSLAPLSPAWPGFWLAVIFALLFTLAERWSRPEDAAGSSPARAPKTTSQPEHAPSRRTSTDSRARPSPSGTKPESWEGTAAVWTVSWRYWPRCYPTQIRRFRTSWCTRVNACE